jgi:hypothetical protein
VIERWVERFLAWQPGEDFVAWLRSPPEFYFDGRDFQYHRIHPRHKYEEAPDPPPRRLRIS